VALLAGAGLLAYFKFEQNKQEMRLLQKQNQSIGKPNLGGPFALVNHHGSPVTDRDFLGRFMLVYFGFTHCPDICPGELTKVTDALQLLSKDNPTKQSIVPIFITIDPRRDSVADVRAYVKEFHPTMIGLTGTPQQIAKVAKEYRVYFNPVSQAEPNEGDTPYLIDHSIITYLMDSNGKFVDYFGHNTSPQEMAAKLKQHLQEFEK
jgi:protein SCO1/2